METTEEDTILVNLLLRKDNIEEFLDSIFGCLARCTDFYHVITSPDDKMGYPPGRIEELVLQSLHKFSAAGDGPDIVQEVDVVDQNDTVCTSMEKLKLNDDFEPADYYNGAKFEQYCWSQTLSDIQIHVKLPKSIQSPKQLEIQLSNDSLQIIEKDQPNNILLAGAFYGKCRANNVVWSFESNNQLQINIDKANEMWWKKFFLYEADIDVQKIDSAVYVDELPEAEQKIVEKLKWEQRQLQLAEMENSELTEVLLRAREAEGSPFRGQKFDPAGVKFN